MTAQTERLVAAARAYRDKCAMAEALRTEIDDLRVRLAQKEALIWGTDDNGTGQELVAAAKAIDDGLDGQAKERLLHNIVGLPTRDDALWNAASCLHRAEAIDDCVVAELWIALSNGWLRLAEQL